MLTGLNSSYGNISFWIKLWNPLDEQNVTNKHEYTYIYLINRIHSIILNEIDYI